MPLFHLALLALLQGLTEFLPISSSGHLILLPAITGLKDQGLILDIAVHVGTLGAVAVYLWRDLLGLGLGLRDLLRRRLTPQARLLLHLVAATIPVLIAGYLVSRYLGDSLRQAEIVAWTTLIFGIVLWLVDRTAMTVRRIEHLTASSALWIGLTQIMALIPGVSRAGITMTAARALGFERREAARFSLLLSIPVIIAAGTLSVIDIEAANNPALRLDAFLATALSFAAALGAIALMMRWLSRASFTPFVIYRVLLGIALLVWIYYFGQQPLL